MKKNIMIVVIVFYLCTLTLCTGLHITAERFSLKQTAISCQGFAWDTSTNLADGSTMFNLLDINGTVLGTYSVGAIISNGDVVSIVILKDTFEVPILYKARQWQEVYVGETLVDTTEKHAGLLAVTVLWVINLFATLFWGFTEWKKRPK